MIAEIVIMAALAMAGVGLVSVVPARTAALAKVGMALPIGAAMYLLVGLVDLVTVGHLEPLRAVTVTVCAGLILVVIGWRRNRDTYRTLAIAVVGAAAITAIARALPMTRLTPDSMRYLLAAIDLPVGITEMNRADLINRQIGLPALHALAPLAGRPYLASLAPLFGASGLAFFTGFAVQSGSPPNRRWFLVVSAVLFLVASNRLLYASFYINTHIQVATYLLIAVSALWNTIRSLGRGWALLGGLSLATTLLFRPEAPLLAVVVIVAVAASALTWADRWLLLTPVLVVMGLWYGGILWVYSHGAGDISLTAPVFGSAAAVATASIVLLAAGRLSWVARYSHGALYTTLALLIIWLARGQITVLLDSIEISVLNLGYHGMWVLTWPVTIALLVVALPVHRVPEARMWNVTILGYGLLFLLLPLLREGAYRIGVGDSGNRVMIHIFPVVVAFLLLAANEKMDPPIPRGGSDSVTGQNA